MEKVQVETSNAHYSSYTRKEYSMNRRKCYYVSRLSRTIKSFLFEILLFLLKVENQQKKSYNEAVEKVDKLKEDWMSRWNSSEYLDINT